MRSFKVLDMSCGHCTATIEKAIKAIDPTATVSCDTGRREVDVESVLNERALAEAIRNAGYGVTATTST